MPRIHRRAFLVAGAATALASAAGRALAQSGHEHHGGLYESLQKPGRIGLPEIAATQHVTDSPAPKAADQGRWITKAPLPLPRSEMAWATAHADRMHIVGGYGAQRVDRPYHQVYDPVANRWSDATPLPRGANHVGVAVLDGNLYAIGGFIEQNRRPHGECFAIPAAGGSAWRTIAPLPRACGAVACVDLGGRMHAIGGAIGDTFPTKKSVDWHIAYDPKADKWEERAPMPQGRDHTGTLAVGNVIHVIGGQIGRAHV